MKTASLEVELGCPYCRFEGILGLANGNGTCTSCDKEFLLPTATGDDEIAYFAKQATEWRARAINDAKTNGLRSSRFYHGVANLWANMLPPWHTERVQQDDMFRDSQTEGAT